jgi:hypothetical protein
MKAEKGMKCVICGEQATERAFDGVTAWCEKHLKSWKDFHNTSGLPIEKAFEHWYAWMANDT